MIAIAQIYLYVIKKAFFSAVGVVFILASVFRYSQLQHVSLFHINFDNS